MHGPGASSGCKQPSLPNQQGLGVEQGPRASQVKGGSSGSVGAADSPGLLRVSGDRQQGPLLGRLHVRASHLRRRGGESAASCAKHPAARSPHAQPLLAQALQTGWIGWPSIGISANRERRLGLELPARGQYRAPCGLDVRAYCRLPDHSPLGAGSAGPGSPVQNRLSAVRWRQGDAPCCHLAGGCRLTPHLARLRCPQARLEGFPEPEQGRPGSAAHSRRPAFHKAARQQCSGGGLEPTAAKLKRAQPFDLLQARSQQTTWPSPGPLRSRPNTGCLGRGYFRGWLRWLAAGPATKSSTPATGQERATRRGAHRLGGGFGVGLLQQTPAHGQLQQTVAAAGRHWPARGRSRGAGCPALLELFQFPKGWRAQAVSAGLPSTMLGDRRPRRRRG